MKPDFPTDLCLMVDCDANWSLFVCLFAFPAAEGLVGDLSYAD